MKWISVLLSFVVGCTSISVQAQSGWRYPNCRGEWSLLKVEEVMQKGLGDRVQTMLTTIDSVIGGGTGVVDFFVTNCPTAVNVEYSYRRSRKSVVVDEASWISNPVPIFGIFITSRILSQVEGWELEEIALAMACAIRTSALIEMNPLEEKDPVQEVARCRVSMAEKMNEPHVAEWFKRYLAER